MCLDDTTPENPADRFRQFLFAGTNRWYDKTLQHIVCPNGVSASLYEHAALDGVSIEPLLAGISAAVLDYQAPSNIDGPAKATDLANAAEHLSISVNDASNLAMLHCRQNLEHRTSSVTFAPLATHKLGNIFLRKHKCPVQSGIQLAIQLASRRFFGCTHPAYETVSMAHFRKGRVEVNPVIGPAMMRFLDAVVDERASDCMSIQSLLYEATTEHNRSLSRAVKGRGYSRHMLALEWMLVEDETRPALFDDVGYSRSKPGKVVTSNFTAGGLEGGLVYPVPESIFVYFEIQDEG